MSALQHQEGGSHYKDMPTQPVEFIHRNGIGFIEGCVIKYVTRWKSKDGIKDLRKARHFLELLIELESGKDVACPITAPADRSAATEPRCASHATTKSTDEP